MTKYIAIEGHGGSGKTYLSDMLSKDLQVPVFHLDDYGNDYEPFIGIPALIEDLKKTEAPVVIYEGIGVFSSDFDEFDTYRIFVNTPNNIRSNRAAGRDTPTTERNAEEWSKIYKIWHDASSGYFSTALLTKADLTVGEDGNFDISSIIQKVNHFLNR